MPIGGTALAKIGATVGGISADMTSVQTVWKDNEGTTIVDMTRTSSDVSTTGINGEAASLVDASGTGMYEARLVIDTTYQALSLPVNFSVTITITDANGSKSETFLFRVKATDLDISLESTSVVTAVRRMTGLLKDVTYLAEGTEATRQSSIISLGDGIIYGIDAAYKNGSSFSQGSAAGTYGWSTYRPNVVLNTAPAANDFYLFTVKTGMSDTAIEEYVLNARRTVLSALQAHYEDDALDTYPTVLSIIQDLCVGEIRMLSSRGIALESAHYRSGHEMKKGAMDRLRRIQQGKDAVVDSDGAVVARVTGSLVGGFVSSFGSIDERGHWWERMQDYLGTIRIPIGQEAES